MLQPSPRSSRNGHGVLARRSSGVAPTTAATAAIIAATTAAGHLEDHSAKHQEDQADAQHLPAVLFAHACRAQQHRRNDQAERQPSTRLTK